MHSIAQTKKILTFQEWVCVCGGGGGGGGGGRGAETEKEMFKTQMADRIMSERRTQGKAYRNQSNKRDMISK